MSITNDFFNKLLSKDSDGNFINGIWQNKLNGQWQDQWGWNIISQPNMSQPGVEDFHLRFDQMRETITFKKIGSARNIGITGQAGFWQSIAYEVDIKNPQDEGIHHEMGHFLLKVDSVDSNADAIPLIDSNGSNIPFTGIVIRQATIPRANSFMTHGALKIDSIQNSVQNENIDSFYSSRAISNDDALQQKIDDALDDAQSQITILNGPNLKSIVKWASELEINSNVVNTDWEFTFRTDANPSQMASGQRVPNPVSIGNLLSDFWIGDRQTDNGQIELLQYVQEVELGFNNIQWPHLAVNTLVKQ